MAEADKPVKICGVCKTGKLMPSGCGCDNAACHNFVDKWKTATPGYDPPKPVDLPKPAAPVAVVPAPAAAPVTAEEPEKKKRGRPKKNP